MRRMLVIILGTVLIAVGIVLLFIPGPGLLFIIAGLAVYATEFLWARRLRNRAIVAADDALSGSPRAKRLLRRIPGVDLDEIRDQQRARGARGDEEPPR